MLLLLGLAFVPLFTPVLLAAPSAPEPSGAEIPPVIRELAGLAEEDGTPGPALTGVLWQWQGIAANDGEMTLEPDHPENYSVTFLADGKLAIQADCNRARGVYTVTEPSIDLQIGGVTRMLCPSGSLMQRFLDDLDRASSYSIDQGTLSLALPEADGMMVFTSAPLAPGDAPPATPATG